MYRTFYSGTQNIMVYDILLWCPMNYLNFHISGTELWPNLGQVFREFHSHFCRDLKPENILLDDKFHIKLTDFGTARVLDVEVRKQLEALASPSRPDGTHERRRNSFVGTAQFVSPECLQGMPAHFGSDLWALGCIIFQMLTTEHLFTGRYFQRSNLF